MIYGILSININQDFSLTVVTILNRGMSYCGVQLIPVSVQLLQL